MNEQEIKTWLLTHAGVESEYNRNLIYNTLKDEFSKPEEKLEELPSSFEDELKVGDFVRFTNADDDQVKWGSNTDPRGLLVMNGIYQVDDVEVHSWHTKVRLVGIEGKFNSVHFEIITEL